MFLACLADLPRATRPGIRQSQGSKPNVAAGDALTTRSAGTHIVMQAVKPILTVRESDTNPKRKRGNLLATERTLLTL